MLVRIDSNSIYRADNGWSRARYHFAYAEYVDPDNECFGVMCAFNDFVLEPGSGFDTHPHAEMEIVSYCVQGKLVHRDSMGNTQVLGPGEVQYLRAGSGVTHSELNESDLEPLRFIQIWFHPRQPQLEPAYRHASYSEKAWRNRLLRVASGEDGGQAIRLEQDAEVLVAQIEPRHSVDYSNRLGHQSYVFCVDGTLEVNGSGLRRRDALKVAGEETLAIRAGGQSHILIVRVPFETT